MAVAANVSPTSSGRPGRLADEEPERHLVDPLAEQADELADPEQREVAVPDEPQVRRLAPHAGQRRPGAADISAGMRPGLGVRGAGGHRRARRRPLERGLPPKAMAPRDGTSERVME